MKKLLLTISLAALYGPAQALTIELDAESLKDAIGAPMQVSGLVVLTAGTSGNFFGPTPTSLVSGDEIILKKWDLSAFGIPGVLGAETTGDLPFTPGWNEGDPLRLYWYPTLGLNSTQPGVGTAYGTYRDVIGLDGSAPWLTPGEGDTISLKFFTSDAAFLTSGGSNPASAGVANLTVVPEPGTALFGLLGLGVAGFLRQRKRASNHPPGIELTGGVSP